MANYYDRDTESQSADTSIDVLQSEFQGIFIKDSNEIRINQTEAQALIVLQIALQAALDVLLIAFDLDDNDDDVRELQSIIQSIKAAQLQCQKIIIKDFNDITLNQQQIQIDALIQVALQLLAKLEAKFIERPNRFVAYCDINGEIEKIHVKNTGRCKELLVPGCTVYLEESDNPNRKTKYSLISVIKENRLINMDSQVTNKMVCEALKDKSLILPGFDEEITLIKPEKTYGNSRFDVYLEGKTKKAFIEIKGCTLEEDNIVKFPDAKTDRGVKHVKELIKAKEDGYLAYIIIVIQMKDVLYFTPNIERHKEFKDVLKEADEKGVKILAYDSIVNIDNIKLNKPVKVVL